MRGPTSPRGVSPPSRLWITPFRLPTWPPPRPVATDARPLSWGGLWETEGGVEREEVEPLLLRPPHDALSWGGRGGGRERER